MDGAAKIMPNGFKCGDHTLPVRLAMQCLWCRNSLGYASSSYLIKSVSLEQHPPHSSQAPTPFFTVITQFSKVKNCFLK